MFRVLTVLTDGVILLNVFEQFSVNMRYDTIGLRWIKVRSKADGMASLI